MTAPPIAAAGDRVFIADQNAIYVVTPSGRIDSYPMGAFVSRHVVRTRSRVVGAMHNGPLLALAVDTPPARVANGLKAAALSACDDAVCVVSFGPVHELQCLDAETLRERWRARLPEESGAYSELHQDARNVYALAQGRALAFDIATGKRLWATNEFTSGAFFTTVGGAALTRNDDFVLEWRDTMSGEVIAQWGTRDSWFANRVTPIKDAVLVESRDRGAGRPRAAPHGTPAGDQTASGGRTILAGNLEL